MLDRNFIETLELADTPPSLLSLGQPLTARLGKDNEPSAAVNGGVLTSFVAGLSAEDQSDVLNSCLLAQLAASKKFNKENQAVEWYAFYASVLYQVGWTVQDYAFEKYNASGDTFTVDKAVIKLLESIAEGGEVAIAQASLDALKSLSEGDRPLQIWNSSTHSANAGNFQIAPCAKSGNVVVMKNSSFYFKTSESTHGFLWFTYSSSSMELYQAKQTMSLNIDVYKQVRQQVIDKLGNRAKEFIADLEI